MHKNRYKSEPSTVPNPQISKSSTLARNPHPNPLPASTHIPTQPQSSPSHPITISTTTSIKLPKLKLGTKLPKLSQQQIDQIGRKVLRIKNNCYDPNGCSRSLRLERVLMLKRINGIGRAIQEKIKIRGMSVSVGQHNSQSRFLQGSANGKYRDKTELKRQKLFEKQLTSKIGVPLTPQYYISRIYM